MIYFSSDWHLSHLRIIELSGRPFDTVEEMDDAIIDACNREVGEDDELYLLGDIAMGQIAESLPKFRRLRCKTVKVVPGNHDRVSSLYPQKPEKLVEWIASGKYEAVGLTILPDWFTVKIRGYKFDMCHLPYANNIYPTADTTGEARYEDACPIDRGNWLLHGHVHQLWRQRGRQINVGVDAWGGRPVSAEVVASMAHAGMAMLDPLPWNTQ